MKWENFAENRSEKYKEIRIVKHSWSSTQHLLRKNEIARSLSSKRWVNATTYTANWSICNRNTSVRDTRTQPNLSGWWISTGIPAVHIWATTTYWISSRSLRTRLRRESDSILWRRCCNPADHRPRNRRIKLCSCANIFFRVTETFVTLEKNYRKKRLDFYYSIRCVKDNS